MSLLPIMFNDVWDDYRRPLRTSDLYNHNFGMGLMNDEIQRARDAIFSVPLRSRFLRPWRTLSVDDDRIAAHSDPNEFRVNLDVQQFKPEELNVKIADGFIVVVGKHEERTDEHGYISRQFTRRYKIPEEVDPNAFVSNLSSDGVLSIMAPKKIVKDAINRDIPITQTNIPAGQPKEKIIEVAKKE